MIKKFYLLVMATLIMPTFGFLDFTQVFNFITHPEKHERYEKLKCFFTTESASFFIKYLLLQGTVNAGLDLLAIYNVVYKRIFKKSDEFAWDDGYVNFGILFTITIAFSLTCPLISVAGFVCLVAKHYGDRHSILCTYDVPSTLGNQRIPKIIMGLIITGPFLQQIFIMIFTFTAGHVGIVFFAVVFIFTNAVLYGRFLRDCVE